MEARVQVSYAYDPDSRKPYVATVTVAINGEEVDGYLYLPEVLRSRSSEVLGETLSRIWGSWREDGIISRTKKTYWESWDAAQEGARTLSEEVIATLNEAVTRNLEAIASTPAGYTISAFLPPTGTDEAGEDYKTLEELEEEEANWDRTRLEGAGVPEE